MQLLCKLAPSIKLTSIPFENAMTATLPFVKETFDRFNALCFEGMLPTVPTVLTKAGTFLGRMEYKSRRDFFGLITSHYDLRMKISTGFDLPQEELEDVVIHEMIHYYIAYRNISDTSAHGEKFRRIMEAINRKYGRHITVRHRGRPEQNLVRGGDGRVKNHCLCVSTFPDGKMGVTVCASAKVPELHRLLPRYYRIVKMEWYESSDPFFSRFPRSRTPKIYKIAPDELSGHLRGSNRL